MKSLSVKRIEEFIRQKKWQTQPQLPRNELYQHLKSRLRVFFKGDVEIRGLCLKGSIDFVKESLNKTKEIIEKINNYKAANLREAESCHTQKLGHFEHLYHDLLSKYTNMASHYNNILTDYQETLESIGKFLHYCSAMIELSEANKDLLSWWKSKKSALKEIDFQPSREDQDFIGKLLDLVKEVQEKPIPHE